MATAADEGVPVQRTPALARLFMVGVGLILLGCVAAMLPFLTGRTHGFSAVLALPFAVVFILCAAVLYWGVKADAKFLVGAKVLLVLNIIVPLTFSNILDPNGATGVNVAVVSGIIMSALYLVYFFRSRRLRMWYRKS